MAASEEKRMIVGLDIGTSKVVAVVGEIDTDGTIDIVGIGQVWSLEVMLFGSLEYETARRQPSELKLVHAERV